MDREDASSGDDPARDRRAGEPPTGGDEERADDDAAGTKPGPLGNPELDEETLRHRQQERRRERG
jgi:hypothetical protein